MKQEHWQLLILGFVMGAAPQFFLASNLMDFSEVKSAAGGGAAVAVAGVLRWLFAKPEEK